MMVAVSLWTNEANSRKRGIPMRDVKVTFAVRCWLVAALVCLVAATLTLVPSPILAGDKDKVPPTVAVLYFDYTGTSESLGVLRKGLAQMLITDLVDMEEIEIVERDRLQDILEELKLSDSIKVDQKNAARVGKLLGARYMVLGSYFDLMETFRIDARVVEVETGKVLKSIGVNGKADDFIVLEQGISEDLRKFLGEELWAKATKPTPRKDRKKRKRPKAPKKLKKSTAVAYAKALDAKDKGEKEVAKKELEKVVEEQPDFELAVLDLALLAQ